MCIIALHQNANNLRLNAEDFENCYTNNPDSWGMMYQTKSGLVTYKSATDSVEEAREKYLAALKEVVVNGHIALHFRIRTSGPMTVEGAHPFVDREVKPQIGFMHNGILKGFGNATTTDSKEFFEEVVMKISSFNFSNEGAIKALELLAKNNASKFVIMSPRKVAVLNRAAGVDLTMTRNDKPIGVIWMSNSSYSYAKKTVYSSNTGVTKSEKHYNMGLYTKERNSNFSGEIKYCTYCGCKLHTEWEKSSATCSLHHGYLVKNRCMFCGKFLTFQWERDDGICKSCIIDLDDVRTC